MSGLKWWYLAAAAVALGALFASLYWSQQPQATARHSAPSASQATPAKRAATPRPRLRRPEKRGVDFSHVVGRVAPPDGGQLAYIASNATNEFVSVQPEFVTWELNEAVLPKTVRVTVKGSRALLIDRAKSSGDSFGVSVETVRRGREYAVRIVPRETKTVTLDAIELEMQQLDAPASDADEAARQPLYVFAVVASREDLDVTEY